MLIPAALENQITCRKCRPHRRRRSSSKWPTARSPVDADDVLIGKGHAGRARHPGQRRRRDGQLLRMGPEQERLLLDVGRGPAAAAEDHDRGVRRRLQADGTEGHRTCEPPPTRWPCPGSARPSNRKARCATSPISPRQLRNPFIPPPAKASPQGHPFPWPRTAVMLVGLFMGRHEQGHAGFERAGPGGRNSICSATPVS